MIISLAGFMGSGKSGVGRELSALLGCPFVDLDACVEEKAGMSIADIFVRKGESAFRQMELECLKEAVDSDDEDTVTVLALGGGTPATPECMEIIREKTHCVYLRARLSSLEPFLQESDKRPMLRLYGAERLYMERIPLYERAARHTIDVDDNLFLVTAGEIASLFLTQ